MSGHAGVRAGICACLRAWAYVCERHHVENSEDKLDRLVRADQAHYVLHLLQVVCVRGTARERGGGERERENVRARACLCMYLRACVRV